MANTIFMIHGVSGTSEDWNNFRPFFGARGYRCIATNLPYHDINARDQPSPRLGTMSLLDYAHALEQEIANLGDKPIIMGHSMGGLLAQMLGARGLAEALVLLTPAAPAGIFALTPSVIRSFLSAPAQWAFWKKPVRQTFAEVVYSTLNLVPENEWEENYRKFVYESGRALFEMGCWFLDPRNATRVDASRVTCPMLVIGATQDRTVPAPVVRRIAKKYQTVATYREFANHAHWVLGEPGWEEIAGCVADWLHEMER